MALCHIDGCLRAQPYSQLIRLQFLVAAISYTLARVEFEVATRVNQLPICMAAVRIEPPFCNSWGDKIPIALSPLLNIKPVGQSAARWRILSPWSASSSAAVDTLIARLH